MKAANLEKQVGYIYYTTNTTEDSSILRTGLISSVAVVVLGIIVFCIILLVKKYYKKQEETYITLEEMEPHSSHQSGTYLERDNRNFTAAKCYCLIKDCNNIFHAVKVDFERALYVH